MKTFWHFLVSLRAKQWIKNLFIFAPMVFSLHFFEIRYLENCFTAFVLFNLVASAVYILNDCLDKDFDQRHPKKKNRPIASGKLSLRIAVAGALLMLAVVLTVGYFFNRSFFVIASVYLVMNLLYSFYLKHIVILDVLIIAIGFCLRVMIGGAINRIELSPWILIITLLLATFLALVKRRQEFITYTEKGENPHTRFILKEYNLAFLEQMISIATSTTLISYVIYVLNPEIQQKFGTRYLYLTVPFVLFGIFRYLYLTHRKEMGENPAEVIFSDMPFALNILLWLGIFVLIIIYKIG